MQKLGNRLSNKGSALVATVVYSIIFAITGISVINIVTRGGDMLERDIRVLKSFWANEAALRCVIRYISTADLSTAASTVQFTFPDSINRYQPEVTLSHLGNQTFDVHTESGVESESFANRTTLVRLVVRNFSQDTWSEVTGTQHNTYFEPDMVIHGNASFINESDGNHFNFVHLPENLTETAHVTGVTRVSGSHVESDLQDYPPPYNRGLHIGSYGYPDDPDYNNNRLQWFEERFPDFRYTTNPDYTTIMPSDQSFTNDVYELNGGAATNARITMYVQNGTGRVQIESRGYSGWTQVLDEEISYFNTPSRRNIIRVNGNVLVRGELDGQLSIVTENGGDIYLIDDITYADRDMDPSDGSFSDDVLGLVSDDDIYMTGDRVYGIRYGNALADDDEIVLDAALYCPNGSFVWTGGWYGLESLALHGNVFQKSDGIRQRGSNGLSGHFYQDARYQTNDILPPGIGFIKRDDPEAAITGKLKYWDIADGRWTNQLVAVSGG